MLSTQLLYYITLLKNFDKDYFAFRISYVAYSYRQFIVFLMTKEKNGL